MFLNQIGFNITFLRLNYVYSVLVHFERSKNRLVKFTTNFYLVVEFQVLTVSIR